MIGMLVGINLISRFILFTAAWTVTEPGRDDVLPSATALAADSRDPAAVRPRGGRCRHRGRRRRCPHGMK